MTDSDTGPWLTVKEAAVRLGVTTGRVYQLARRGQVESQGPRRHIRILAESVDKRKADLESGQARARRPDPRAVAWERFRAGLEARKRAREKLRENLEL